jgi:hypothetical protein
MSYVAERQIVEIANGQKLLTARGACGASHQWWTIRPYLTSPKIHGLNGQKIRQPEPLQTMVSGSDLPENWLM